LVDAQRYFFALLRYIHTNPVAAKMALRAEDHPWSSDRAYRRGRAPDWLDLDRGYFLMQADRTSGARHYRRLMGEADPERYEDLAGIAQTIKGDENFAADVIRRVEVPELVRRSLRVDQVARAVAEALEVDLQSLRSSSRKAEASRARAMTAHLGKL